jgi:hypothetical protein
MERRPLMLAVVSVAAWGCLACTEGAPHERVRAPTAAASVPETAEDTVSPSAVGGVPTGDPSAPEIDVALLGVKIDVVGRQAPCGLTQCEAALRFTNRSPDRIRALQGAVAIDDVFQRALVLFELELSRPIGPGEHLDAVFYWSGLPEGVGVPGEDITMWNWLANADPLRSTALENLSVHWFPRAVIYGEQATYADGGTVETALQAHYEALTANPFSRFTIPTFRLRLRP